jgi:hypothetical protein
LAHIPLRSHVLIAASYAAIAVAYSWPLPLHFSTHLTGATTGDTGVYVWNQWVFQREILDQHRLPYFTDAIFSLTGDDANLSLHNYTTFQNLLALPLMRSLGVVATFNVVMLLTRVLTAFSMFLLARQVTGRIAEAWIAGLAFAWSPILVTRSTGHFSLVAAAPLAIFLLFLAANADRERWGWRQSLALGLSLWWAASADAYYGVFCLLIGALFLGTRLLRVTRLTQDPARGVRIGLDAGIAAMAALVLAIALRGGWRFAIFDQPVSVRSLYTPVLLLTVLASARIAWHYRLHLADIHGGDAWRAVRVVTGTGVATAVLLSPMLYAIARRVMLNGLESAPPLWRSSPRGVDVVALFLPNPNHPLAPAWLQDWLSAPTPDAYLENVVSIPLVAIAVAATAWACGWQPARWWLLLTGSFGLLALGPFVHVAGVNTFVPGPWALLRYVPIVGLARTPSRFSVVMMLGVAVLLAAALSWVTARLPRHRRLILTCAIGALLVELLPAPRPLYSGEVPSIYTYIASSPLDTRVLHLPFGVRDGTMSEGDFSAQTQFFQTAHGRRLIGGYLSRVSPRRRAAVRNEPVLAALMTLSENRNLSIDDYTHLLHGAPDFFRRANVGFVVINRTRMPQALDEIAIGVLGLELIDTDGPFELYRPAWSP